MCSEWAGDFAAFFRDMGSRPAGTSLDRIDVNGNYEPGNCRWATVAEQARTRTDNVTVDWEGRTMVLRDLADLLGLGKRYSLLTQLIRDGRPVEEAVRHCAESPVRSRPKHLAASRST